MCGIAGLYQPSGSQELLVQRAKKMAEAITHRGPDAQGVWTEKNLPLALAHQRLSIQDLSASGAQPMHSHNGQYTIVYNGEIYNFNMVREELTKNGVTFVGRSDTEVLIECITHFGIEETLRKIKGMFAFALWNNCTQSLTLARDRIGEKPLYYGVVDGELIFASELKSIYEVHSPRAMSIDKKSLASFLRNGYISAPHSVFQEIKKLPPGCFITIALKDSPQLLLENISPIPYWSVGESAQAEKIYTGKNIAQAKSVLSTTLNHVIQEQAVADVPLGAFLSGGIDSSLVSAVLQDQSDKPIDTFTIGFNEKAFNEAEFAKDIAKHIGSNHHEQYVEHNDVLDLVDVLPHVYDEPFADASQLPMMLVSRFAKTELKVCLSGDGGDELFCGYNRYTLTENVIEKSKKLPSFLREVFTRIIHMLPPSKWDSLYFFFVKLARRKGGAEFGSKLYKMIELANQENLNQAYLYLMSYWQAPEKLIRQFNGDISMVSPLNLEEDFLNAAMAWDQQWYLPGDNLTKTDRASMSASIELRAPLLDVDMIEFAWQVSPELKLREGKSKWLLREMLYQYVPKSLIERPKMGFSVPVSAWLNGPLRGIVNELLGENFLAKQKLFHSQPIRNAVVEHQTGTHDHGKRLWTLLMFQMWYSIYLK